MGIRVLAALSLSLAVLLFADLATAAPNRGYTEGGACTRADGTDPWGGTPKGTYNKNGECCWYRQNPGGDGSMTCVTCPGGCKDAVASKRPTLRPGVKTDQLPTLKSTQPTQPQPGLTK